MQEYEIYPMSKVDPADTRMELSCVGAGMVAKYYGFTYGDEALGKLLYDAKINLVYISNSRNWMSFDCFCRLLKYLVLYTENPNAPFDAWQYMVDSKSLGPITLLGVRMGTVRGMYSYTVSSSKLWSRINEWKKLYLGENRFRLSIMNYDYPQDKNNCNSIKGLMAAIPQLLGFPPAEVEEIQCACDGADSCIFDITWVGKPAYLLSLVGTFMGFLSLLLYCVFVGYTSLPFGVMALFPVTGFMGGRLLAYSRKLKRVYLQNEDQAESLQESMKHIEDMNEDLYGKVEDRTTELIIVNENLQKAMVDLQESQSVALQAERQAGVGVLAAGMAHELNNPINAIRLSVQTFKKAAPEGLENLDLLTTAEAATARCRRIVSDLLSFSRKDSRIVHSDLKNLLEGCVRIFKEENTDSVEISLHIEEGLPRINVDEEQMQQVIRNLMSNAVDAMEETGNIDICFERDGDDVVIKHKDTGPGINSESRARIFDPFFSSKAGSSSKGLGLSICVDLVKRNGGVIDLVSDEGKGAEFVIRFPVPKEIESHG